MRYILKTTLVLFQNFSWETLPHMNFCGQVSDYRVVIASMCYTYTWIVDSWSYTTRKFSYLGITTIWGDHFKLSSPIHFPFNMQLSLSFTTSMFTHSCHPYIFPIFPFSCSFVFSIDCFRIDLLSSPESCTSLQNLILVHTL